MAPAPAQTPSTRAMAHGLDEIAGHAREEQQFGHRQIDQRRDDVVHVAAGTEVLTRAVNHHGFDVGRVGQLPEQIAQFGIRFEGERVFALRAVQREGGDSGRHRPAEMLRLVVREGEAVAG
jgi:hypothetical protein